MLLGTSILFLFLHSATENSRHLRLTAGSRGPCSIENTLACEKVAANRDSYADETNFPNAGPVAEQKKKKKKKFI
jgi:hypothetical protein